MFDNKILKNLKLIVTDIDGTLLDDNGKLGVESKKLIKELIQKDIVFTLATGRLYSAAKNLAEELSLNGFIISLDGAAIKDFINNKTIFESFLKTAHVKKAISVSEELLIKIVLCHSNSIYFTEYNSIIPMLLNKYGAEYLQVESYEKYMKGTLEIVCASDMKNSVKQMEEKFHFPYTLGCDTSFFRSHTNENIYYLEIRKAGSSKGRAFERLLKHLGIKPMRAAVIGDWYNDITMFNAKAVKVAVANAVPELINSADIITAKSNNEDGAAEFFEMVLKAKRN
jgi:Cof subfamily protein (haloacid dehalogenase superfamily)